MIHGPRPALKGSRTDPEGSKPKDGALKGMVYGRRQNTAVDKGVIVMTRLCDNMTVDLVHAANYRRDDSRKIALLRKVQATARSLEAAAGVEIARLEGGE